MIFQHFLLEVNEANSFLVACERARTAWLIDCGDADPRIDDMLAQHGLRLEGIFITHDHYDHTDGVPALLRKHEAQVIAYKSRIAGFPTRQVSEGSRVCIGDIEGLVVETAGHTPDGISLILPGLVFTGDALFSGSVGGTSSRVDAARQLEAIRRKIFTLPDDCEIHVGHGPSSVVWVEREYNPFFRKETD